MQRSTPDSEIHRRPEGRSVQEIAADSLVGKATSEILMLVAIPLSHHAKCLCRVTCTGSTCFTACGSSVHASELIGVQCCV